MTQVDRAVFPDCHGVIESLEWRFVIEVPQPQFALRGSICRNGAHRPLCTSRVVETLPQGHDIKPEGSLSSVVVGWKFFSVVLLVVADVLLHDLCRHRLRFIFFVTLLSAVMATPTVASFSFSSTFVFFVFASYFSSSSYTFPLSSCLHPAISPTAVHRFAFFPAAHPAMCAIFPSYHLHLH